MMVCNESRAGVVLAAVEDIIYLADSESEVVMDGPIHEFSTDRDFVYVPFCDDFGPMNLADVCRFVALIEQKLVEYQGHKLVYRVGNSPRKMTNAVFLLGSYMVIKRSQSPEQVWNTFKQISDRLEMYRDATFSESDFLLTLIDCWRGLAHAKDLGWTDRIDLDEYSHYDNPLEGDLHMIVPDKLVAFKGPRTLPASWPYLDQNGCRLFSPSFYLDAFSDMNVTTVVRLNEEEYQAREFEDHGISCVDLEFEDCSNPPTHVIIEFLHVVDRAEGVVAVHCKAGLGRTGTLIAIYMMRTHGFTAREAMGWLRIVRPGSVIGDQQSFLCRIDAVKSDMDSDDSASVKRLSSGDAAAAAAAASAAAAAAARNEEEDFAFGFAALRLALGGGSGGGDRREVLAEQVAAALHSPTRTSLKAQQALRCCR